MYDFNYRNRPAALRADPASTYYRDRAAAINADMATEQHKARALKNTLVAAALLAIAGVSAVAGFTIGSNKAAATYRTYDLVQFHGAESDIVDYDLSREDCQTALLERRTDRLACELSR